MSEAGTHSANADYVARGMASEAMQIHHSHDALDNLRFQNMDKKLDELKKAVEEVCLEVRSGFRSYDNKFWSLAVSIILLLITGIAALVFFMITHPLGH